ncbi:MAG: hypothetical protein FWH28_07670, partial [Clostridiales bacterium]|nr:hypothetical protein [Clostridiales bacterium]
ACLSHGKITMIFQAMGATDGDSSPVWRTQLVVLVFDLRIAPCLPVAIPQPLAGSDRHANPRPE